MDKKNDGSKMGQAWDNAKEKTQGRAEEVRRDARHMGNRASEKIDHAKNSMNEEYDKMKGNVTHEADHLRHRAQEVGEHMKNRMDEKKSKW